MRKVLIITDSFPPVGGPGSKRITQFTKYLREYRIEPIILTHSDYSFMGYDERSLKQIPNDVEVHRTKSLEKYVRNTHDFVKAESSGEAQPKRLSLINNPLVRLIKSYLGVPDTGMLWMPFALPRALKIFRKSKFDSILATGPGFSTFVIGSVVSRLTRRPLILDFRDAWAADPEAIIHTKLKKFLHARYERMTVGRARYVIANTEGVLEDFLERYPKEPRSKFHVIPNGYDLSDRGALDASTLTLDRDKLNMVHTGSLWSIRNPKTFLQALSELVREKKIDAQKVRIHFVGLVSGFDDGSTIEEQIEQFNVRELIHLTGFVSREEAFSYNRASDVLLLLIGVTPETQRKTYGLSGKVYDYILTEKPIFALAQKGGATYRLLDKYQVGLVSDPLNVQEIKENFLRIYNHWKNRQLKSNYSISALACFDMRNLTGELSKLL